MADGSLELVLRDEVGFLQDCKMQRDLRGHSRAACYVLEKMGQQYFMKVYSGDRKEDLWRVEATYAQLNVNTAKIIKTEYLEQLHKTFCIYEYIDGKTLNELLGACDITEAENLGYLVGKETSKFVQLEGDADKFQSEFEAELKPLWANAYRIKREYNMSHEQKLPVINLPRLEKSAQQLKEFIYATKPTFVHSDINLNNIIIHDGEPYFIDTDGGKIKFRALDFRGNCWWGWSGSNVEKERAIYRGIYRGMFNDAIPDSFHQELAFTMIYEFIMRLWRYRGIDEQTHYSFLRWHENLKRTNYFEKYKFPWF